MRILKAIVSFTPFRQIYRASLVIPHFSPSFLEAIKWSFKKTENSNFYYDLSPSNYLELSFFVSEITGVDRVKILSFIDEARNDAELSKHIIDSLDTKKTMKDSQMFLGRRIGWYAAVRAIKPRLVVETGVHHGLGAVTLIRALEMNAKDGMKGRYLGTDIDPDAGVLVSGKYLDFGHVIVGDSIETLLKLEEEIDMFINDSDHSSVYEAKEYEVIHGKLSTRALVLGDNCHGSDSLLHYANLHDKKYLFFQERPLNHWYPGAGIGAAFTREPN